MVSKKKSDISHKESPETQMLGLGYNPWWSEGAVKPPLFLTSTFMFRTAEDGEEFFSVALGKKKAKKVPGLIYSRLNNPALEILETRLAAWEDAGDAAVFASGMAAISTMVFALCKPGDSIAYTIPIYGGTSHFFTDILRDFGIKAIPVDATNPVAGLRALNEKNLRMIFVETPSNPTLTMTDLHAVNAERRALEKKLKREIVLAVDNTLLGPVFQKPVKIGADLSVYSATKFIGGHSDLIAGAVVGNKEMMNAVKGYRSFLGTMSSPFSSWLMLRSLETLKIRMETQAHNAGIVADFLAKHKDIEAVYYPGHFVKGSEQEKILRRQCTGNGSLLSFEVKGGKKRAFKILNAVKLCRLAVSLGGTETLIEHPKTMTHSEIEPEQQERSGVTDGLIRLSVGLENPEDIIADLKRAIETSPKAR
jgi:methionine-gamma-lyase